MTTKVSTQMLGQPLQPVQTASFTAGSGLIYPVNTYANGASSPIIIATLPTSPVAGQTITFLDYAGTFNTLNFNIAAGSTPINGVVSSSYLTIMNVNRGSVVLMYIDSTQGWIITNGATVSQPSASSNYMASALIVAGGGSGGWSDGGGGGAGGLIYGILPLNVGTAYTVTIGGGGAGINNSPWHGANGSPSLFGTISAAGGGGGGGPYNSGQSTGNGYAGGSGGGGGNDYNRSTNVAGGAGNTPSVTPSQGNAGGNGTGGGGCGGGGGAGAAGQAGYWSNPYYGGNGGAGVACSITGTSVYYAGGGGGGAEAGAGNVSGTGGNGGGGGGETRSGTPSTAGSGTVNTGGGGGGGMANTSGAGGSGVVIISYPNATQKGSGGTVTSYTSGSTTFWVHKFTSSGTYTA